MTGISSLRASVDRDVLAMRVDRRTPRPGRRLILRMPPSVRWRRVISSVRREASFFDEALEVAVGLACLELVEQAEALA